MTSPRRQLVDPAVPGFYHCVSRCVRRAFLCGQDAYTGQDFEQRKAWIEQRLLELARWFSLGVYAYAVMSNHLHIVVHIDPATAASWSPKDAPGARRSRTPTIRNRRFVGSRGCPGLSGRRCKGRFTEHRVLPYRQELCRKP